MIKISQLHPGNFVMVNDEGVMREGMVIEKDLAEHMVKVDNGIQEFWYPPEDLHPIPLDENQLLKLGFEKVPLEGNAVKYKKGAFRLVTPAAGDFSRVDMWYREDNRHFHTHLAVHELQNLHEDMTKVPLERA
jgi:hypothetical protein